MASQYLDLLACPIGAGGIDTPARLQWTAAELGYSTLGIFRSRGFWDPSASAPVPGIRTLFVADDGSKNAKKADLRIAGGRAARRSAGSGTADYIIPDTDDVVALRFAAENQVPVAYAFSDLLKERLTRRSALIRRWISMHRDCRRFGCRELVVSAADDSYLMRDPRDIAYTLSACLGIAFEETIDWVTSAPESVVQEAMERRGLT